VEALERVGRLLRAAADTETATQWRKWDAAERYEFQEAVRDFVARRPHCQRVVFQEYADNAGDISLEELHKKAKVSEKTGDAMTLVGVKSALREARAKAREFFRRKGYQSGD